MFCVLEKDLKTFEYFRRYAECFENGTHCMELDNRIQAEELEAHLLSHGFSLSDTQQKLDWITANGRPFREYLNTIKLVYVMCKTQGIDPFAVTQEQFLELEDRLNQACHCLGSIF